MIDKCHRVDGGEHQSVPSNIKFFTLAGEIQELREPLKCPPTVTDNAISSEIVVLFTALQTNVGHSHSLLSCYAEVWVMHWL